MEGIALFRLGSFPLRHGWIALLLLAGCSSAPPAVEPPAATEAPVTALEEPAMPAPEAPRRRSYSEPGLLPPNEPPPERIAPQSHARTRGWATPRHIPDLRRNPEANLRELPRQDYLELVPLLVGEASWYGPGFHRKKTASGETYNQYGLTAAHPTLPMGTDVLVENTENGRRVQVRINDRGPYKKDRILDLSRSAAIRLGMIRRGTAPVQLTVVRWPTGMDPALGLRAYKQFVVQVAAYPSPSKAETERRGLRSRFDEMTFHIDRTPRGLFAIFAGPYDDEDAARRVATRLQRHGITNLVRSYRK